MTQAKTRLTALLLTLTMLFTCVVPALAVESAEEGPSPFDYGGGELAFIDENGAPFSMFVPQEGTTAVIEGDNVVIHYVPRIAIVYGWLYWGGILDAEKTKDVTFNIDGTFDITLSKSNCGKAIPACPLKRSNDTITTTTQYYLAIPSADKLPGGNRTDLTITNNTGMFKAVDAYLEALESGTELVMTLSGSGYHDLFKGTYAQAVDNGLDDDAWIHGQQNAAGQWEFRIPIEEGETYVPCVAISHSYYTKFLNGEVPLARAFYPRQLTLDPEAATLVTGDYDETFTAAVTSALNTFLVADSASMRVVGGPNSNNYQVDLTLRMEDDVYDQVTYPTVVSGSVGEATAELTANGTFDISMQNAPNLTAFADGQPISMQFRVRATGETIERRITINLLERSISVDGEELSTPPTVTVQPEDAAVAAGARVAFSVKAEGEGLTYQWQVKTPTGSWKNSGASSARTDTLSFTASAGQDGYQYRCVVGDSYGASVTSNEVTLTVSASPALTVTVQPEDAVVAAGARAAFSVKAEGEGLTYQWQVKTPTGSWKNSGASSAKTDTLSFTVAAGHDGYQYRCVVKDSHGASVTSDAATLTLGAALTITAQPEDAVVAAGAKASFTVAAEGEGLTYQWQVKTPTGSWKNSGASSAKTDTLSITVAAAYDGYQYRCVVKDSHGASVTSDAATLTLGAPLTITVQPEDAVAAAGAKAAFSVKAEGEGLTYQWQVKTPTGSWKNSGASSAKTDTLSISVTAAYDGYQYRCVVKDSRGASVTSDAATLTLGAPLAITAQPQDILTATGVRVSFAVAAEGEGLTYQWQYLAPGGSWKNSGASSAKTDTLSLVVAATHDGYQYRCVVKDSHGASVTSDAATLTLGAPLTITAQPQDILTATGVRVSFAVAAEGQGLTYQWQFLAPGGTWKNSGASSAKTEILSFAVAATHDGYQYRCIVKDSHGASVTSDEVTLTVGTTLTVTAQPEDVLAPAGRAVTFTVAAEGDGLAYQWQAKAPGGQWADVIDATAATLSVTVAQEDAGSLYRCVVTDSHGVSVTSDAATLTVGTTLTVTAQPEDVLAPAGRAVTFTVAAEGDGLAYQWQVKAPDDVWKNSGASSAKTATLTINVTAAYDGYQYRCVVTDSHGVSVTSDAAALTVGTPLAITAQPQDAEGVIGASVTFTVAAEGDGLTYRWQAKAPGGQWADVIDAASATLTVTAAQEDVGTRYRCVVTDQRGASVTSAEAELLEPSVLPTPVLHNPAVENGGVRITWGAVPGAVQYRVFVKGGSYGSKWTGLGNTADTAYVHTAVDSGVQYTYTVRCISADGAFASDFDADGKTVTYVAAPVLNDPTSESGGVRITWGAVPGAVKYRVFVKNGNSWSKLGDVTATAYTHAAAVNGVSYTYTVRCVTADGSAYTSGYDADGKTVTYTAESAAEISRVFYNQLDQTQKSIYDIIASPDNAAKLRSGQQITIPYTGSYASSEAASAYGLARTNDAKRAGAAYLREHPELFWLRNAVRVGYSYNGSLSNLTITVTVQYTVAVNWSSGGRNIAADETAINARVQQLVSGAAAKTTRYEKLKYVHDWLTANNLYNIPASYGDGSDDYLAFSPISGLDTGLKPVCEGYSKAFKVVCDRLNIPCILVTGVAGTAGDTEEHMWNYVRMEDGKWYAVDVTWDDPVNGVNQLVSGGESHNYFLVGSTTRVEGSITMAQNHTTDNRFLGVDFSYPTLNSTKYNP